MIEQRQHVSEQAHDRFIAAAAAFRRAPSFRRASDALAAYRRFYLAFTGPDGLAEAVGELRRRLARTLGGR